MEVHHFCIFPATLKSFFAAKKPTAPHRSPLKNTHCAHEHPGATSFWGKITHTQRDFSFQAELLILHIKTLPEKSDRRVQNFQDHLTSLN